MLKEKIIEILMTGVNRAMRKSPPDFRLYKLADQILEAVKTYPGSYRTIKEWQEKLK